MSLDNKPNKPEEPKSDLDGFFFNLLLFTVVIIFPITLIVLTAMYWS